MNEWSKIKKKSLGEIPQEASQNIQAPELAPSDKRITGRTKQLNLKVREEIYWLLKEIALQEKKLMTEILEKALTKYKGEKEVKSGGKPSDYGKVIECKPRTKPQPKLTPYLLRHFDCDNCGDEYYDETAYSYAPNMNEINGYKTYCSNCVR